MNDKPLYAVMLWLPGNYLERPRWITHTTESDANLAYQTVGELFAKHYHARVVEYHSRDWEGLVR